VNLFLQVDRKKLARIRRAPLPPSYFAILHEGLDNSVVAGRLVLTSVSECTNPEMIAELADMMLRLENIRESVCYGVCEDRIYFSVRTVDGRGNAAERVRRVVKGIGSGGGHRSMAAGQVPLQGDREKRLALVRERILKVFAPGKPVTPLC
jgi:nanoRNase/pAp phosphatase (c-di-AMP/oligoRNAs hydrolase)